MINKLRDNCKYLKSPINMINLLINIFFGLIVLLGIYITFKMNKTGRSLWYDEAALAMSMTKRSIAELTSTGLDNCQSAPVIWCYLVKLTIITLGNSEFTLRLMSSISYIGVLICSYYVFRNILRVKNPMGATAFVSMIPLFIRYSNVFKPYEFDALCVLLVIVVYYLYRINKINSVVLAICWSILIWCSNPSCFFEGGLILEYTIEVVIHKDWKKIKNIILIGFLMLVSFIAYYFYWLRQSVGYMQDYWDGSEFPLIPLSMHDIRLIIADTKYIYSAFENIQLIVFILSVVAFIGSIIKKNHILIGIYLGFLVTLFASYIGMFPISDRLWVFSYPLIGIFSMIGLDYIGQLILKKIDTTNKVSAFLYTALISIAIVLLLFFGRGWRYLYSFNHYWLREEINYELEYIQNNIQDDESIFIFSNAFLGYQYKTDYGNKQIFNNDTYLSTFDYEEDAKIIKDMGKCYIVSTHYDINEPDEPCNQMLQLLRESGYVQLVAYDHMTPVYYYCSDMEDIKPEVNPEEVWY